MAHTWVGICNLALTRCGAKQITSLSDIPNGVLCGSNYEIAVDEVIEDNDKGWSDTIERVELTVDSTAPLSEKWAYRYLLPAAPYCLRVIEIEHEPAYVIEGRYILTNEPDPITIIYAKRITDPTNISNRLAQAIGAHIASMISYRLVQDRFLRQQIMQDALRDILKAKGKDAMARSSASSDEKGGYTWAGR